MPATDSPWLNAPNEKVASRLFSPHRHFWLEALKTAGRDSLPAILANRGSEFKTSIFLSR